MHFVTPRPNIFTLLCTFLLSLEKLENWLRLKVCYLHAWLRAFLWLIFLVTKAAAMRAISTEDIT